MPAAHSAGRTAIVTGASRGFGRAVAVALAASGARVVGVARNDALLENVRLEIGSSFTPVVADVADEGLATRLIAEYQPTTLVLNAGATPRAATIQTQTWAAFSDNWHVDVRHVFEFVRAALLAPLEPGSSVISVSSGAARQGSPMSGGYAGAKATIKFISAYAGAESERNSLGIRFVAVLPKLTPLTGLGSTFVDSYADYDQVDRQTFRERLGASLAPGQFADAVIHLAAHGDRLAAAYLLTADGLTALE